MFQHFRSGNASFLINMADQQYRHAAFLGILQNGSTTLAHLRNTARRRFDQLGKNRLNRIDNQQIGLYILSLHEYLFQIGLA